MFEPGAIVTDSLAGGAVCYTNETADGFGYQPSVVTLAVDRLRLEHFYGPVRLVHLIPPAGWQVKRAGLLPHDDAWEIRPGGQPTTCLPSVRLVIDRVDGGRSEIRWAVPIEIRGRTQFDPARHALSMANSAHEFGEIQPSLAAFRHTYHTAPLSRLFFNGLYRQVVYLTGDPAAARPGGLCTGIARSTLEQSLSQPLVAIADMPSEVIRERAIHWHGKQLADRALIASAWAWLTGGSAAAYRLFRRDVLRRELATVAMDVNVPRPWRRDILSAFIGNGHTVVPYRLRQSSDDRAEVWVYDPNHWRPEEMAQSVIRFDLAGDSYRYRHYDGRRPGKPSKVIAVPQEQYRRADTGLVGLVISLGWLLGTRLSGGRWRRAARRASAFPLRPRGEAPGRLDAGSAI